MKNLLKYLNPAFYIRRIARQEIKEQCTQLFTNQADRRKDTRTNSGKRFGFFHKVWFKLFGKCFEFKS